MTDDVLETVQLTGEPSQNEEIETSILAIINKSLILDENDYLTYS